MLTWTDLDALDAGAMMDTLDGASAAAEAEHLDPEACDEWLETQRRAASYIVTEDDEPDHFMRGVEAQARTWRRRPARPLSIRRSRPCNHRPTDRARRPATNARRRGSRRASTGSRAGPDDRSGSSEPPGDGAGGRSDEVVQWFDKATGVAVTGGPEAAFLAALNDVLELRRLGNEAIPSTAIGREMASLLPERLATPV